MREVKILTIIFAMLIFGASVSVHSVNKDRAMTVCLKHYSEGYCVEALN